MANDYRADPATIEHRRLYDRERNRDPARRAAQAAWKRSPRGKLSMDRSKVRLALRRMPSPTRRVALLVRLDAIEREISRIDRGRRSPNPRTAEDLPDARLNPRR